MGIDYTTVGECYEGYTIKLIDEFIISFATTSVLCFVDRNLNQKIIVLHCFSIHGPWVCFKANPLSHSTSCITRAVITQSRIDIYFSNRHELNVTLCSLDDV